MTVTASSMMRSRSDTSGNGRPIIANSARVQPAPTPAITRPPLASSSWAKRRACIAGWRKSMHATWLPIRMRFVRCARVAMTKNSSYAGVSVCRVPSDSKT